MTLNDQVLPELRRIRAELARLNACTIHVGIQGDADSEILTIARVHEFGATITPKNAKNLCIPIHKESYDKSPRDFPDLFFIRSSGGYLLGVEEDKTRRRKKSSAHDDYGVDDKQLKLLFLLLPSVTIPERSFIRAGFDANRDRLAAECQRVFGEIIHNGMTAETAVEQIGIFAVEAIQQFMNNPGNFKPKGKIQKERAPSWANSPLTVTKRMINSITFNPVWGDRT